MKNERFSVRGPCTNSVSQFPRERESFRNLRKVAWLFYDQKLWCYLGQLKIEIAKLQIAQLSIIRQSKSIRHSARDL